MTQRLQIFLVLGLVILIAACMGPAVDPGPNPAKLVVSVQRQVTSREVREALSQRGPMSGAYVRLDSFLGPFWELSVQQRQADGSWMRLPPAPGQDRMPDGYGIETKRVFLAPPGPQDLRLRLEAFVNRTWEEQVGDPYVYRRTKSGELVRDYQPNWRSQSATIYVLDAQRVRRVELKAGQELEIRPFN